MTVPGINRERLLARLKELGEIGRDDKGRLTRLAGTDADRSGRERLEAWMYELDLEVEVDAIGNIYGTWNVNGNKQSHLIIGSHIDTVIDAGIYDGCYGVLSGLEVIAALKSEAFKPSRPVTVVAFTNEEGVRFAPDMMGSLVASGALSLKDALSSRGTDGKSLGEELKRIGYAGDKDPGFVEPFCYIELHIEQGPLLERDGIALGAVENLQGISWQEITIEGVANHAGTTPMSMRSDAGLCAARIVTYLADHVAGAGRNTVATVGRMSLEPNGINIIPSKCVFSVDLRNPDEGKLNEAEAMLSNYLQQVSAQYKLPISVERLVRTKPVTFDDNIVNLITAKASARGLTCKRMSSGAGHDAQMMAAICPTAMIFVPSVKGISHNPAEYTSPDSLYHGVNVLLDVVRDLSR